jgi:hypothetical protein
MKIWQLDSIVRDHAIPAEVASTKEEWYYIKEWFREMAAIQARGDRNILNSNLPSDFVKLVLRKSNLVCYKYKDGTLRSYKVDGYEVIPAVDVYLQYGGDVLERIFERSVVGDISDDFKIRNILKNDKKTS